MKSTVVRPAILTALVLGSTLAAGCATVQPWQRGTLADPCMVFDANRDDVSYQTHWQESREGSMGGFGVQGGGCGCK
jgi:Domain of unknown function (DUF4266)